MTDEIRLLEEKANDVAVLLRKKPDLEIFTGVQASFEKIRRQDKAAIDTTVAALSTIEPHQFRLKEWDQTLSRLDAVIAANTPKIPSSRQDYCQV